MTLFLYAPKTSAPREDIEKILAATIMPDGSFEIFRTINDLSRKLRHPKNDLIIVVLLPADREDILDVFNIRHLFRNTRVILVVPDLDKETIALAHRLRPRYLTYVHGNLPAIGTVIDNMCSGYAQA
jgi:hypothetical protein